MAFQYINTGTSANSGNGDSIRSAFTKVNQSFSYIENLIEDSAINPDPILDSLIVNSTSTFLGDIFLNTTSALLSYDPDSDGISLNFYPILGNYKFFFNNLIIPNGSSIIGTTSTYQFPARLRFTESINTTGVTTSSISLVGGLSQLFLSTEFINNANTASVSLLGSADLSIGNRKIAAIGALSPNGSIPGFGAFSAEAGTRFTVLNTSSVSQDYSIGLVSVNDNLSATGILANSRGTWINGGVEGVTIANENFGWQFTADGRIIFPDGTQQTTAFTGTDFTGYATEEFVTTRGYLTATDVAGFITTESDPIFSTSTAASITATNVSNWNTAYGWGDHASAGYLVPTINTTSTTAVSLANTSTANLDVTIGKAYILYKVETSHASWVRMYTDSASRSADSTRQQGQDPSLGSGVIAEVITTGSQVVLLSPGVNGFNNENPITGVMPMAVTNLSGSENTITVTITKLTLVP